MIIAPRAALLLVLIAGCEPKARDPVPDVESRPVAVIPPAAPEAPAPTPPASTLREVFPHVRVDTAAGIVEFDGMVPIDVHNAQTPRVYLEVMVCIPDTKEHETLIVTPAKPSHVHAALLLCGGVPGKPGAWDWEGKTIRAIPPEGPWVRVTVLHQLEGQKFETPLSEWAVNTRDGARLTTTLGKRAFVFAGSRMSRRAGGEVYSADAEGCLVGLTTFGGETIAWPDMFSPDTGVQAPEWIAAPDVPARGTAVVVRLRIDRQETRPSGSASGP